MMKYLNKLKKKMARKLKTENGKPQPMNEEEIQDLKDEINKEEKEEEEEQ